MKNRRAAVSVDVARMNDEELLDKRIRIFFFITLEINAFFFRTDEHFQLLESNISKSRGAL